MRTKESLYRNIGEQIKEKRLAASLKQEDLAGKVGLTRSSIAQIEAGKQAPSIFLLYQLCDVLNADLFKILPKDEFDPLSAERIADKTLVRDILDKLKTEGGEYAAAKYSDSGV
jgi:transcriptional regulator with XRE-family HTH domain